jgi:ABC-type transporter Mla MlaB component
MPVAITVNAAERIRYTTMSGDVSEEDVISAFTRAMAQLGVEESLDQIIDMRDVQRLDVSGAGIWQLAELVRSTDDPAVVRRVAVVASSDQLFGMARMYQALRSTGSGPAKYRVFREMRAAREWLGLGPGEPGTARS